MWTRRLGLTAAVAAALLLAGTVSAASAGGTGHHRTRTLQLRTTVVSSSVNDAGHGGVANVTAVLFTVTTPAGEAAGQAFVSCVVITTVNQLCHASFVLADGQIEAQAQIPMGATAFTAPITGGSGAFEGVGGQIDNVVSAPGVTDRTFHLLFPRG